MHPAWLRMHDPLLNRRLRLVPSAPGGIHQREAGRSGRTERSYQSEWDRTGCRRWQARGCPSIAAPEERRAAQEVSRLHWRRAPQAAVWRRWARPMPAGPARSHLCDGDHPDVGQGERVAEEGAVLLRHLLTANQASGMQEHANRGAVAAGRAHHRTRPGNQCCMARRPEGNVCSYAGRPALKNCVWHVLLHSSTSSLGYLQAGAASRSGRQS